MDGLEPQAIREILETEIAYLEQRHEAGSHVVQTMSSYSPAMGLVGTVVGLIFMLETMSDPSTIGPAMAVALTATFYGVVSANLLFLPLSNKLKERSKQEVLIREMEMEGHPGHLQGGRTRASSPRSCPAICRPRTGNGRSSAQWRVPKAKGRSPRSRDPASPRGSSPTAT